MECYEEEVQPYRKTDYKPMLYSAVTVECCIAWVCLVCLMLCKEEGFRVFAITERRDMGLYEMPLSMPLLGSGDHISQLPYVWYYVVV